MKKIRLLIVIGFIALSISRVYPQSAESEIIIYRNFAYIVEYHAITVNQGFLEHEIYDLPLQIHNESIFIECDSGNVNILWHEYDENTFNFTRLLQERLGEPVVISLVGNETVRGTLIGLSGSEVLIHQRDVISAISKNQIRNFSIEGITDIPPFKPVLRMYVSSDSDGDTQIRLNYLTGSMGWSAEYVGMYDSEKKELLLSTRARIRNNSGNNILADNLMLVAGEPRLNRRRSDIYPMISAAERMVKTAELDAAQQFEHEEAFIYHKYTLNYPIELGNNIEKQISLFQDKIIPVTEKLLFDVNRFGEKVVTFLEFKNEDNIVPAEPLPAGTVKIYQREEKGTLFLGENNIANTPVDGAVKIHIGTAFDVTGKRILKSFNRIDNRRRDETYEITILNASNKLREIEILERFGGQWEIIESSGAFTVTDAQAAKFVIEVPSGGEVTLAYTVRFN